MFFPLRLSIPLLLHDYKTYKDYLCPIVPFNPPPVCSPSHIQQEIQNQSSSMRLISLLPIALLFIMAHLTVANPAPAPAPADSGLLLKRQRCPAENDCTCAPGTRPGVYCWGCDEITYGGSGAGDVTDWVFQCGRSYPVWGAKNEVLIRRASTGGSPSNCCSFGPANDCANGATGRCG